MSKRKEREVYDQWIVAIGGESADLLEKGLFVSEEEVQPLVRISSVGHWSHRGGRLEAFGVPTEVVVSPLGGVAVDCVHGVLAANSVAFLSTEDRFFRKFLFR